MTQDKEPSLSVVDISVTQSKEDGAKYDMSLFPLNVQKSFCFELQRELKSAPLTIENLYSYQSRYLEGLDEMPKSRDPHFVGVLTKYLAE